jgi:hypothetical protein
VNDFDHGRSSGRAIGMPGHGTRMMKITSAIP